MPWLNLWSWETQAWQREESGPSNSRGWTSGCLRNCWTRSHGKKSLETKEQNRAVYSVRMLFWEDKSSPSFRIRMQAGEIGNWHGLASTCWSNYGKRRASTVSRSKGVSGMLSRLAKMGLGKLGHRWNWTHWDMFKKEITKKGKDSTGT